MGLPVKWKGSEGPGGMSMFSGEAGPFAGVAARTPATQGWVPYVQVEDVDRAPERAASDIPHGPYPGAPR